MATPPQTMNFSDDGFRNMLESFKTSDLQTLMDAFGRNRSGRKIELKNRALEMLRVRSVGFNHQAYLAKILELYQNMQNVPSNDMLRNMTHGQGQQQIQLSMNVQPRTYQTPQYTQQMTRAGLPQLQRGIYGNSNMRYSYQASGPHSVNQYPSLDQPGPVSFGMSSSTSGNSNSFNPFTSSLTNIKLKKLPFYEVIGEILKPIQLTGQDKCTLQNVQRGTREATFKINLSMDYVNEISMNRDISNGKNEYLYQMQIRICELDFEATEITDCMPLGLQIRVCHKTCPLPPNAPNTRPGTEARRMSRPINCTQLLKLNPNLINFIAINWIPDKKNYVIAMYLVKKLSTNCLLQKLQDKGARSSEATKNYIIRKLADVDPDLATTSYRFSLVCPLGKTRMKVPAKSINCDHLQCFDATTFILMNEKKPTWTCPTCNKPCLYEDIQIESYFLDIVSNPNLSDCTKEIEILSDGTWRVYEIKNMESSNEKKENPIESVDLDSDEDNSPEIKKEWKPENSKESENLKSSFIDLTLSDDDEQPKENDKQENEAKAVDAVQPQQAVTSSEEGVVIEIDSPSPPSSPIQTTSGS